MFLPVVIKFQAVAILLVVPLSLKISFISKTVTVLHRSLQVRERCRKEWTMFQERMASAERAYYASLGIDPPNSTAR